MTIPKPTDLFSSDPLPLYLLLRRDADKQYVRNAIESVECPNNDPEQARASREIELDIKESFEHIFSCVDTVPRIHGHISTDFGTHTINLLAGICANPEQSVSSSDALISHLYLSACAMGDYNAHFHEAVLILLTYAKDRGSHIGRIVGDFLAWLYTLGGGSQFSFHKNDWAYAAVILHQLIASDFIRQSLDYACGEDRSNWIDLSTNDNRIVIDSDNAVRMYTVMMREISAATQVETLVQKLLASL